MQNLTPFRLVQAIFSQTKPFSRYKLIKLSNAVFAQNPWTQESTNFKIGFRDLPLPYNQYAVISVTSRFQSDFYCGLNHCAPRLPRFPLTSRLRHGTPQQRLPRLFAAAAARSALAAGGARTSATRKISLCLTEVRKTCRKIFGIK